MHKHAGLESKFTSPAVLLGSLAIFLFLTFLHTNNSNFLVSFLKGYYDQIFTPCFFACITKTSMKE